MAHLVLPTSPNWYLGTVSDVTEAGLYAFGARNSVTIFDVSQVPPRPVSIFTEHTERVTCVALNQDGDQGTLCCSASDDRSVKIWDVFTKVVVKEHNNHNSKVTALSWWRSSDLVVSGDDKGGLISWQVKSDFTLLHCPEKDWIFSMAFSPTSLASWPWDCLLASGSKDWTIRVWSTTEGRQLQLLRVPGRRETKSHGRDKLWTALHWPRQNPACLLSSSANGALIAWDLQLEKAKFQALEGGTVGTHNRVVFNLCAGGPDSNILCSFGQDRLILLWDLTKLKSIGCIPSLGGFVYQIKASPLDPGQVAVGVGDGMLRVWNLHSTTNAYRLTSLWQGIRGKVMALSWHPVKESLLAFGTDDGQVGIVDVSKNKPPIISTTFHQGSVYCVAWGPASSGDPDEREGGEGYSLALYSVGDGNIMQHWPSKMATPALKLQLSGFQSASSKDSSADICEMSWNQDFSALAVGFNDGCVQVYSMPSWLHVCTLRVHNKPLTSLVWHPQFTGDSGQPSPCRHWLASAGNDVVIHVHDLTSILEGSPPQEPVELVQSLRRLSGHKIRVPSLCWSPHSPACLASVGYEGRALVWNVRTGEAVAQYEGHSDRLMSVHWSGLDADVIMTGGSDNSLHCWHVSQMPKPVMEALRKQTKKRKKKTEATTATTAPSGQVQPESPVTGAGGSLAELQALLEEKCRELKQQQTALPPPQREGPHGPRVAVDNGGEVTEGSRRKEEEEETEASPAAAETAIPETQVGFSSRTPAPETLRDSQTDFLPSERESGKDNKVVPKKKRRLKSYFPASSILENQSKSSHLEDILQLTRLQYAEAEEEKLVPPDRFHLGLYTDRKGAHQCLRQEERHHLSHDNMEYYLQLEIWKGNIRGALQKASEREELSDWLVAMAPLASYDTWRGVCEEYAGQLERDGQYHKASLFLLASHHVHPAIELFKRHRLFKEAVTLARIRLSPLDPMLEDLYTEWANHLMKEGNYEQAAKCYLALKQVQDAAKVLTRRCDQPTLRTACQMTLIANEKQQGLALAYRSLQGFLARHQWSQALASLHDHQALKVFVPFVGMHELVMRELRTLAPAVLPEVDSSLFTIKEEAMAGVGLIPDFILDLGEADPVLPWRPHVIGEHSFPHHVLRCWQASLTMETEALRQMYRTLSQLHSVRQSYLDIPQILVQVSLDLTLFLLGLLLSETSQAIGHLLQAMSSLHEAEQFSLMQAVCQLMLPLGPKYVLKLQQEVTAFSVLISMERNIGDVEGTAKAQTIRRFLSELREDSVSSSGHRCRELDCLRAYCYLAALHCLQVSVEGNGSPTAASTLQDNASSSEGTCVSSVSVRRNEASGVSGDCSSKPNSDGKPQQSVPSGLHTKSTCSENEGGGGGDAVQTGEIGSQKPAQDSKKSYSVSSATSGSVCKSRDLSQGRVTAQDRDGKTSNTEGVQSGSNSGEVASQPDVLKTGPDLVSTAKAGGEGTGVDKDQDGSGRVKVTLSCLLQLSQGLLWDVQAKRVALTETLGYIHRAISQHLLAERPHPPEQSKSLGSSGKTQGTSSSGEEPPTGSHMEGSSVDSASGIPTPADKKLLYSQLSVDESDPCGLGLGAGVGPDVIPKGRRVLWEDDTSQCLPGEMGSCGHMCMGTHTHPHPHHHSHPQSHPHSAVVPRYPSVPEEWYSMSVDTKYTCPYVTMMILRQEQDLINHELKRVPDSSQMPFPNPLDSVHMLLRLSQGRLTRSEQMDYRSRLVTWAMQYAVTSIQRSKLQSYELPHHQP